MTRETLKDAERAYQRAASRAENARKKRNALVVLALAEGWSHQRVAEATGLTRSRVGQIALSDKE